MKKYIIGVDIGGTKVATGLVSKEGKLKKRVIVPTLSNKGMKVSLQQVYNSINELIEVSGVKMKDIEGIGVCAPGPLDPIKGIVHNPPNLKGWKEVPLVELMRKKFRKKVKLEKAFHDQCIKCHKKLKKEKKKTGPTSCTKCHPKKKK